MYKLFFPGRPQGNLIPIPNSLLKEDTVCARSVSFLDDGASLLVAHLDSCELFVAFVFRITIAADIPGSGLATLSSLGA